MRTLEGIHLVTGGSGYFGSLLVEQLRRRGLSVRNFDLNENADRPKDVEFIQGDIRDRAAVERACRGVAVIHHSVAQVPLAKDKELFWTVNRDGTETLLAAAQAAGVRKVVHLSSSAVYGAPERNPVTEDSPRRPGEEYGAAKLAAEEICARYVARGLDISIIRPRTIMGHGRLGIMQILFEWIRNGRNVPVLGRGDNLYQFIHADDLADACIRAAETPGANAFNIGAERFDTMRATLEGLIAHAGTGSRVVSIPAAPAVAGMTLTSRIGWSPLGAYHALMYGRAMYFDVSRAKSVLGWSSRFGNVEMFCDSYDWYLRNREEVLQRKATSPHRAAVDQGILKLVSLALGPITPRHARV